jgi:hypothetical protein
MPAKYAKDTKAEVTGGACALPAGVIHAEDADAGSPLPCRFPSYSYSCSYSYSRGSARRRVKRRKKNRNKNKITIRNKRGKEAYFDSLLFPGRAFLQ